MKALLRLPIFYGWFIVAISMLAAFLAAGLNNISMAVVFKPLSEEMGWSRSLIAGAVTAGTLGAGLLSPLFGRLADRLGPRLLLPVGTATVGSLAIGLSLCSEPWQFYVAYTPARALGDTLLAGVVPITAVTNWFYLKRPRAMGWVVMAVPMGSAVLALVYQFLISLWGWRSVFVVLGALLWIVVVLPGAVLLRRQPEDLGLLPDGENPRRVRRAESASSPSRIRPVATDAEYSWRPRDAMRTRALWFIVIGVTLSVIATGGIGLNLLAYYTDIGIGVTIATGSLSLFALAGSLGNVFWGALAERFDIRRLTTLTLFLAAVSVAYLLSARGVIGAFLFSFFFGLTARGNAVLAHVLIAHYFGRRSFGAISGIMDPFARTGLGAGGLIAAAGFDLTGGYEAVFIGFIATFLVATVLIYLAERPEPPNKSG